MIIASINVVMYNVLSSEVEPRPLIFVPKWAVHKLVQMHYGPYGLYYL